MGGGVRREGGGECHGGPLGESAGGWAGGQAKHVSRCRSAGFMATGNCAAVPAQMLWRTVIISNHMYTPPP